MKRRTVFAGFALPVLLVGCGTGPATGPQDLGSAENVRQDATVLTEQIRGTAAERQAAEFLRTRALNLPTSDCMSAKGLTWNPALLTATPATILDPLGGTTWLREPMRPIASQNLIGNRPFYLAERESNDVTYKPGFDAALNDCLNNPTSSTPSDDTLTTYPATASALDTDLRAMIEDFETTLPSPAVYDDCMTKAGHGPYSASDPGLTGYATVQSHLQNTAPDPEFIPKPGQEQTTPEWDAFEATEGETLSDDAECRSDVYTDAIATLGPKLDDFAEANKADLERVDQHWATALSEAEQQGFKATVQE